MHTSQLLTLFAPNIKALQITVDSCYGYAASTILSTIIFILLTTHCICEPLKVTGTIETYFSPNGGATEAIFKEINAAKEEILVQAYFFKSAPIAKALVDALKRGVKIDAVLDKSQRIEKYTSADFVDHADITTYSDSDYPAELVD